MSDFILELKASWVGNRSRKFYQATRGIMAPEERIALEEEFDRMIAEVRREAAERALTDAADECATGYESTDNSAVAIWLRNRAAAYRREETE